MIFAISCEFIAYIQPCLKDHDVKKPTLASYLHAWIQMRHQVIISISSRSKQFDTQNNSTLSQVSTTKLSYANNFDPDEISSKSVSHPDPICMTLRQLFP